MDSELTQEVNSVGKSELIEGLKNQRSLLLNLMIILRMFGISRLNDHSKAVVGLGRYWDGAFLYLRTWKVGESK